MIIPDVPEEDTSNNTPSRPRRSCAAKVATYKDEEKSPVSSIRSKSKLIDTPTHTTTRTPKTVPAKEISPLIITVEDSDISPPSTAEPTTPHGTDKASKKLAPLFMKALPKPTVDPKVREARQSFLMSDMPDKLRQEMEKKRQLQEEVSWRQLCLFPEVSHVSAASGEMYLEQYDEEIIFPRCDPSASNSPPPSYSTLQLPREKSSLPPEEPRLPAMSPLTSEYQKKQLVRNLKADGDGKFPAYKFYKWLVKRQAGKDTEGELFTDRYRPTSSKEFVFNLGAVQELKEYLEGFNAPALDSASSYETEDDECSNSMDTFGNSGRQTLVLHGGCSVGKTSAVYAIAQELNYNVIEINASSKRNGAKVLHKLMEATQSHKLATAAAAKMSLSRKIVRRMEREEKRMSIIFVEDVDVIFAEDNGFLAAITQLMSLTKRPIILTTNNRRSVNLRKTFDQSPQFRFLHFRRPTHAEDCLMYLHLVGVVQGCHFDPDYLRHLYGEQCRRDLRQALLQLNFTTMTKEIELQWSGESEVVDLPCFNLEGVEEEKEDRDLVDLAWTMDQLCVADRWRARELPEMDAEFREVCLVGSRVLDRRCDGTFHREVQFEEARSL